MKKLLIIDIDDKLLKEYGDFAVEYELIATSKEDKLWRDCVKFVGETELKPLPKKKKVDKWDKKQAEFHLNQGYTDIVYTSNCLGYNACIDEILKSR